MLPSPAVRRALLMTAALIPAALPARTVILANAPGTAPNGATNTAVPATFGDNVSASVTNIFDATAGADGTVGTPNIDLTWSTVASPLGSANANRWEFHTWGGATTANTGGGALQMDGSRTGSKFNITFTPTAIATVKINSFNFVGDTNADVYQYRVRVIRVSDSQEVFTTDTPTWTTATSQNPTNTNPPTWAGAPKVDVNFTGSPGLAYRLEIERLNDDSARTGSRVDIAIDNLDFDQLTLTQQDLTWSGALSSAWITGVQSAPKNWTVTGGAAADFVGPDQVTFDDSATGSTTVDISGADVLPSAVTFAGDTKSYTLTGSHGIAGNIGIDKTGTGNLTLANPNAHTGRTLVDSGALVIAHPLALQSSLLEANFGSSTHAFGAITNATLGGLAGSADLVLENPSNAAVALTLGANHGNASHFGEISGSGSIIKTGTGRQTLGYPNTYTGGTTVAAGTLLAGSETAFGTGTVTSTGGIIEFEIIGGQSATVANDFVLPGGSGALRMFASFGAGRVAPSPGTTVRLTGKISGGAATREFYISDTGITQEHDNTTILDNPTNDFLGTVYINRATIAFTSDAALGNAENDITHFSENLAGKLRFDADHIVLNAQRAIVMPGAANVRPIDVQGFTGTIAGPISGIGTLVKQGSGKLILTSPDSTFTGAVNVTAGTLQADGVIPTSASVVTVSAGAKLTGSGTVQRSVSLAGGEISGGSGVGTLQGLSTVSMGPASSIGLDLSDWTGAAGTGYDTITAHFGAITADVNAPVTVRVTPQSLVNFTDAPKSFTLLSTTGGITGLSPEAFTVDASALPAAVSFNWSVEVQGNALVLVYGGTPGSPFETWTAAKGLTGNDALFDADPDQDGIANGIEFVLGGEPNPANPGANSSSLLPTLSRDGAGTLTFTFRRADDAAGLNPVAEYSTTLSGAWTTAQAGVNGVNINETNDGFGAGIDRVEVSLPASLAPAGRLFVRLSAAE